MKLYHGSNVPVKVPEIRQLGFTKILVTGFIARLLKTVMPYDKYLFLR